MKNKFIIMSIQKESITDVAGGWEPLSRVWEKLQKVKSRKAPKTAVWLDKANVFRSISYKQMFLA